LGATSLRGAQVTATIETTAKAQAIAVRAQRLDGLAEPLMRSIVVPGTADVSLPDGLWELRLDGGHFWMPPLQLRNTDAVSIKVWPTAALRGTSNVAKGLRVQFTGDEAGLPSGEADCSADPESWTCRIVPGRYDLRFSSPGFAPEHRFGVIVGADSEDRPLRLHFVPGASLSGRVAAVRRSKISVDAVEVSLFPAMENARDRRTTATDSKGFFQFKGLPPGDYLLRAAKKGTVSRSESINILSGAAAELNTPLLLDLPKRLGVTVMPRLDPTGNPWRVRLSWNDARLHRSDVISESPASEAGEWSHPALVAGDYLVGVFSSSGERWKVQDVAIDGENATITILALARKVRGVVSLGDGPLQASLSFDGEGGPKLISDELGQFEGSITPDEGKERTILVEAETPRVKRVVRPKITRDDAGDFQVIVDLPSTTLLGRVSNEDRSPEPRAWITVSGRDPETFQQTFVEPDGSFQMLGFEPGSYRVTADADGRLSKPLDVELRNDKTAEVELILQRTERIRGRAMTGEAPAIAADVYAFPRDSWAPVVLQALTDESGFFQLDLPPRTTMFDFVAVHPAFDILLGRTAVVKDKQLGIRLYQMGGTITIESNRDDRALLLRNGAEMPADWLANKAGGTVASGRITIPRLIPSQYSICTMKKTKCVSGYLPPHGTLTLSLASD
jgi:hypothetical protein